MKHHPFLTLYGPKMNWLIKKITDRLIDTGHKVFISAVDLVCLTKLRYSRIILNVSKHRVWSGNGLLSVGETIFLVKMVGITNSSCTRSVEAHRHVDVSSRWDCSGTHDTAVHLLEDRNAAVLKKKEKTLQNVVFQCCSLVCHIDGITLHLHHRRRLLLQSLSVLYDTQRLFIHACIFHGCTLCWWWLTMGEGVCVCVFIVPNLWNFEGACTEMTNWLHLHKVSSERSNTISQATEWKWANLAVMTVVNASPVIWSFLIIGFWRVCDIIEHTAFFSFSNPFQLYFSHMQHTKELLAIRSDAISFLSSVQVLTF